MDCLLLKPPLQTGGGNCLEVCPNASNFAQAEELPSSGCVMPIIRSYWCILLCADIVFPLPWYEAHSSVVQFEREDKQSAQKKSDALINKYKLTSLASKPDIQPQLQAALAKVGFVSQQARHCKPWSIDCRYSVLQASEHTGSMLEAVQAACCAAGHLRACKLMMLILQVTHDMD